MQIRNSLAVFSCVGLLAGNVDAAKNKNKPGKSGSSGSSSSSITDSSMSSDPTTSYFTDPDLKGKNVPTTGFSSIDSSIEDMLGSYSDKNKLYSVTVESDELNAGGVQSEMLNKCGAKTVSSIVAAGLDKISENQDLQDILRIVALKSEGDHQITVKTIDAPGNSTFEKCLGSVSDAQVHKAASGSVAQTVPIVAAGVAAIAVALAQL